MLALSFVLVEKYAHLSCEWKHSIFISEAYEQEHATPLYFCNGVFIDQFIFRSNLLWMRPPWECHNQSQDSNWRHCVIVRELRFFFKRKGILKIDQSVKMPWHRLSMGVASSCSSAPVYIYGRWNGVEFLEPLPGNHHSDHIFTVYLMSFHHSDGKWRDMNADLR